ncbi:hypothetical protein [Brachybacterium squillarum]|uniref:hypothetical protein n=1 Tax=Brachybacterium squillarum TaxID=661979 RepID=UPI002221426C|nr:hypothetical protein [Brachybacterium squillarum]MCW1803881.1 hypothetical protein [Brachybacterium squillarum]
MTWRTYLGRTMTGTLGTLLDVSAGSVGMSLNAHDDVQVTCSRASLDGVDPVFRSYRSGCLVVTYEDATGRERIISAAPISAAPTEDRKAGTVSFTGKGPGWLLEDRVLLDKDYSVAAAKDLRKATIRFHGDTWPSIVGEIVRLAMLKPGGWLPIVTPPRETGTRQHTYEGWNLANNGAWKRIQEITEVIGGPDVAFRPRWTDDAHTAFEWELLVGNDQQQTLPQDNTVVWDGTSPEGDVATIDVATDATGVAHRVYATGAGEGKTIALEVAQASALAEYMPLVEKVISDSDAEADKSGVSTLLQSKAAAGIATQQLDQIDLTVHADPLDKPAGTWWCGELARVVTEGWLDVPDGEHLLRMIATKYTLGSDIATVQCQADYLGEELAW